MEAPMSIFLDMPEKMSEISGIIKHIGTPVKDYYYEKEGN